MGNFFDCCKKDKQDSGSNKKKSSDIQKPLVNKKEKLLESGKKQQKSSVRSSNNPISGVENEEKQDHEERDPSQMSEEVRKSIVVLHKPEEYKQGLGIESFTKLRVEQINEDYWKRGVWDCVLGSGKGKGE